MLILRTAQSREGRGKTSAVTASLVEKGNKMDEDEKRPYITMSVDEGEVAPLLEIYRFNSIIKQNGDDEL